jgi:hypothetical protein
LPIGFSQGECLAVLAGVGTALVARIGRFELTIGAQQLPFDQAKAGQEVDHHRRDVVDDVISNAVAEVTQIALARYLVVEAGELPVATSFLRLMKVLTKLGIIDVLIHFGRYFQHDQTGRVVAASTSGAVIGRTQGACEAEIQGGADKPTEVAIDMALRRQFNGMGGELIVRQPTARGFGKWGGEGLSVVLIEDLGLGDQGIEIKGRELLVEKR